MTEALPVKQWRHAGTVHANTAPLQFHAQFVECQVTELLYRRIPSARSLFSAISRRRVPSTERLGKMTDPSRTDLPSSDGLAHELG